MDFKNKQNKQILRFNNRNTEGNRNTSTNKNGVNANPFANAFTASNIYQNKKSASLQPKQSATGLNRFKKVPSKGAAPKGQFKKYLSEANNIFYEDRWELKQLQKIKLLKWGLFFAWVLLALSYFIIGRIQAYDGVCPQKAICGVFVHCPDLFQYDSIQNQCKLSSDFLKQFEDVARSKIERLQFDYGWQQCKGEDEIPLFNVNDLLNELEDQEKVQFYRAAANNFFNDKKNQQTYGFSIDRRGNVKPTKKQYTLGCSFILIVSNFSSIFNVCCVILGGLVIGFLAYKLNESRKYSKMYQFLKARVLQAEDKTLNVTHTLTDLQAAFGPVNEIAWNKINDLRASDKKIGYYEDDFLYWKAA